MKPFHIVQFGHASLRTKAKPVTLDEISNPIFRDFIASLKFTLADKGVGLAAPQVAQGKRVFLADLSREEWNEDPIQVTVCINPEILASSEAVDSDWEGCLSAPGLWGMVERATEIKVTYLDENAEKQERTLRGLAARIFQHELDHLNGVLFVDRMKDMTTLMTDEEFRKLGDNAERRAD